MRLKPLLGRASPDGDAAGAHVGDLRRGFRRVRRNPAWRKRADQNASVRPTPTPAGRGTIVTDRSEASTGSQRSVRISSPTSVPAAAPTAIGTTPYRVQNPSSSTDPASPNGP